MNLSDQMTDIFKLVFLTLLCDIENDYLMIIDRFMLSIVKIYP